MRQVTAVVLVLIFNISFAQWTQSSQKEKNSLQNNFHKAQFDNPDLAAEYEFEITKDPNTNLVPYDKREKAMEATRQLLENKNAIDNVQWTERGPKNVSGRTRAIMFDPNYLSNNKVWAAGISGGLWYNTNIENNGIWQAVNDFWENIAVSCLIYDPTDTQTFYAGTGEGWTSSSVRGAGIWKSSNSGASWSRLASTDNSDFHYIQSIVITNTGRIIASTNSGLFISDDDGDTWYETLDGFFGDIELAANGKIYTSSGKRNISGTVYRSTDNGDNWDDLEITTDPTERTEIASAPSSPDVIYAVSSVGRDVSWFKRSEDAGDNWDDIEIPMYLDQGCSESTSDFARGQVWYDLIMKVSPENDDIVYVGGIDWHKTTNGGSTWTSVSYWTGACGEYVHADQHAMSFFPNDNSKALVGCDGGVFLVSDMTTGFTSEFHANNNYNVTQFYGCAMENISGSNYMLAGAQDNGTQKFTQMGFGTTSQATGGDGGFCFIDQDNSQIQITSYVYNNWRLSMNGGNNFSYYPYTTNGSFINPGAYDSQANVLYASSSADTIFVSDIYSDGNDGNYLHIINGLEGEIISSIKVSNYTDNTIIVGTNSGKIFRITNASSTPTSTNLDLSFSLPIGRISSIDIGTSEDQILLSYSNYGVESVWQTTNGGANWTNIEYNLPDMPIRGCLYNPNNTNQILLATETGVWSMNDITIESNWEPSNSGLANVRCDQLRYRDSDKMVAVATYGRGLFTSDIFADPEPIAYFEANRLIACPVDTIKFTDMSTKNPDQWLWTITPNTVSYLNGTNQNSQNPVVQFESAGQYTVELTATNADGSGNLVKSNYIQINEDCEYVMSNDTIYTCSSQFYDSGYNDTYSNGQDYVLTFYPTAGFNYIALDFSMFDVEFESNCNYDYLSIYDGPSTSSPLIGKYCGTDSPGVVTGENNAAGALTFKFHSDGGAVANGWVATVGCIIDNIEEASKESINIYPNPAKDYLNIELGITNKTSTVKIFDLMGKLVYSDDIARQSQINISAFTKGMYILQVNSKQKVIQQSIIIE